MLKKDIGKLFENHYNVNGENESMDMDGSESDQELTGNETDEVNEQVRCMSIFELCLYGQQKLDITHFVAYACTCI